MPLPVHPMSLIIFTEASLYLHSCSWVSPFAALRILSGTAFTIRRHPVKIDWVSARALPIQYPPSEAAVYVASKYDCIARKRVLYGVRFYFFPHLASGLAHFEMRVVP